MPYSPVGGFRHAGFVDRERDQRRTALAHERQDRIDLAAAALEVNRVDDRATGVDLQRRLDHLHLGRIDHQRRLDRLRELLDDRRHLHVFIGALGERSAHVEDVRAAGDLLARDQHDLVVVLLEEQTLDATRALGVDALADQQRAAVLFEGRRGHGGSRELQQFRRRNAAAPARSHRREGAHVIRRGSAATADRVDAEIPHEGAEFARHLVRALGVDRLALRTHERQAGVGNHRDETARRVDEVAHRIAHVRRAGRAVQPDDVDR